VGEGTRGIAIWFLEVVADPLESTLEREALPILLEGRTVDHEQ